MKLKKVKIFLCIYALLILFGCSKDTNSRKFSEALQSSSIGESEISYNNKDWFDFVKQDEEIQNYYLDYLDEIGECLSNIKLEKSSEEEFNGIDTIIIELDKDNQHYEFDLKYVYPETNYLMIKINDKIEYYFLDKENSNKLSEVILESDTRPFNHITLLEYLQNEN